MINITLPVTRSSFKVDVLYKIVLMHKTMT